MHAAGVVISPLPCAIWFRCTRPTGTKLSPSSIWAGWKNSSCSRWISGVDYAHPDSGCAAPDPEAPRRAIVPEDLPLDDKGTYEVFCKGFTSGVFQFESGGMRDILRRYQPSRLEDLTRSTRCIARAQSRAGWWTTSSSASGAATRFYDLPS